CLALNLQVPMLLTKIMLPALRGGSVVNIASSGGWDSGPYGSPEYGAAKAGLIRFSTAAGQLTDRGVRVSCIVPHWIGLPRATVEFRQLSPAEQRRSGGLVDPDVIAGTVIAHTEDPHCAGRVTMIRPQLPPYDVDPADYDPHRPA
ncbi:MAG: SDR family oxidoreductase, partial [Microlunatus sp.]|nr:SDR family oxidoreductase [Microlunatus sp.]